jgi:hypothetical protein
VKEKESIGGSEKERTEDAERNERKKETIKLTPNHFLKLLCWILPVTKLIVFNFGCVPIVSNRKLFFFQSINAAKLNRTENKNAIAFGTSGVGF